MGGPALSIAAEGARLELGDRPVQVTAPMLKARWYELRVIAAGGRIRLRQTALQHSHRPDSAASSKARSPMRYPARVSVLAYQMPSEQRDFCRLRTFKSHYCQSLLRPVEQVC